MFKFIFVFLVTAVSSLATAAITQTCGQMEQPVPYSYCITKAPNSSLDVLYYFHGGGGDANQWPTISKGIYLNWESSGVQPPVVITISFGEYWLLVEPNGSENSGLLPVFQQAVMPQMEMLAVGGVAARRLLMGLSMGGFNSTQVLAKMPPETFSRAVMACPALVNLSPFASEKEILEHSVQTGADIATLTSLSFIAKAFVPDEQTWNSQVNPYQLLPLIAANPVPLLIGINQLDHNFKPGGDAFAQMLLPLKQLTQIQSWPGGHCALDSASIAQFLATP